ncbi:MAG TPA: hypothetical protein DCK83_08720 [Gallionellaceae bacterium]|nr:hypothetical protein [Gallionellaceae bacterium]
MPAERHLKVAELLARGVAPVEACIEAGWPAAIAAWLGLRIHEHLAKVGITVRDGAVIVAGQTEPSGAAPATTKPDAPSDEAREAEPAVRDGNVVVVDERTVHGDNDAGDAPAPRGTAPRRKASPRATSKRKERN